MKKQYPDDYWPPKPYGRCEQCGYETKAYDKRWQALCPEHWQALIGASR